jgi:hypothetical protein
LPEVEKLGLWLVEDKKGGHPERLNGNEKSDAPGSLTAVQASERSRMAGLRCFAPLSMTGKFIHKLSA